MSYINKGKRLISPTHPGEMLREDFLKDYGLSPTSFAKAIGVSGQTVDELLKERRGISPIMALRLSRFFGNTPQFWLNAQQAYDLWNAEKSNISELERIKPMNAA